MRPDDFDPQLGLDPFRDRPRKATPREIQARLNVMCEALNFLSEQVSQIRHDLGYRERLSVQRRKTEPGMPG